MPLDVFVIVVFSAFIQKTDAAYVVAIREFSVVIATGLGVFLLKENLYRRKIAAIGLLLLGMLAIKMT